MRSVIRHAVHNYFQRRTQAGTPWWVYGIALAVANAIRQAILWSRDTTTAIQIGSFVAMLAVVIPAVAGISALVRRLGESQASRAGPAQECVS